MASIAAIVAPIPNALADRIADGDVYVDESPLTSWPDVNVGEFWFGCQDCHFYPLGPTMRHVEAAIKTGNAFLFGATLHQLQDWYAHWNEGYRPPSGHALDTAVSGATPLNRSRRLWFQLQDFFWGWHLQPSPYGIPTISPSPFPAHPRDEVVRDIQRRNPGIVLSNLSDNDLIDLFLRKDGTDPNWRLRVSERWYFGLDTDKYIASSRRDTDMRMQTRAFILDFLFSIIDNCTIDWSQPDDAEIKALLTDTQSKALPKYNFSDL